MMMKLEISVSLRYLSHRRFALIIPHTCMLAGVINEKRLNKGKINTLKFPL